MGHKLSYKFISGFGDLESVDSLCRDGGEVQYMQCLSIALLYLPCCEKDLQRQERQHSPLYLFPFLIIRVFFVKLKCVGRYAVTFVVNRMNGYKPVAPQMAGNGQHSLPGNKAQGKRC